MHDLPLLINITLALVAAFFGGILARRIGLPTIVGYLFAGILIGPFTPGFVGDVDTIQQLLDERKLELRQEQAKTIVKKLYIGCYITYQKGKEVEVGIVDVLTSEYVGISSIGQTKGRKKRINFIDIISVSDEAPSTQEEAPVEEKKTRGRKKAN